MLIGVIASMGAAGFVAGYLGRHHYYQLHGGILYGFITWSLVLIMSVLVAGPLMNYTTNYGNSLRNPVTLDSQKIVDTDANKDVPTKVKQGMSDSEKAVTAKDMAWSGWIVFALFFIGALSSCIGACWAMGCKRTDDD